MADYHLTRLVYLLATNERTVRRLLAVVAVLGLVGAGWMVVDEGTQRVTTQTDVQAIETNATTSALVANETVLYENGTRISEPVYLVNVSPTMTIEMETTLDGGQLRAVEYRPTVELRALRDEGTFWRETRSLPVESVVVRNESARATATLNVSALRADLVAVTEEIDGVGGLRVSIRMETDYRTDSYEGTLTTTAPLRIDDRSYSVVGDLAASETRSTPVSTTVTSSATAFVVPIPGYPLPVPWLSVQLLGVSVVAVVLRLLFPHVLGLVATPEIDAEMDHVKHASWISTGRVALDDDERVVAMGSLHDLVEIAADTGERVIHDPDAGAYFLVRHDTVYRYGVEAPAEADTTPEFQSELTEFDPDNPVPEPERDEFDPGSHTDTESEEFR